MNVKALVRRPLSHHVALLTLEEVRVPLAVALARRLVPADWPGQRMGRWSARRRDPEAPDKFAPVVRLEGIYEGPGLLLAETRGPLIDLLLKAWRPAEMEGAANHADDPDADPEAVLNLRLGTDEDVIREFRAGDISRSVARERLMERVDGRQLRGREHEVIPLIMGKMFQEVDLVDLPDPGTFRVRGTRALGKMHEGEATPLLLAPRPGRPGRAVFILLAGNDLCGWDGERLRVVDTAGSPQLVHAEAVLGAELAALLDEQGTCRVVDGDEWLPRPDVRPVVRVRLPGRAEARAISGGGVPEAAPFDGVLFVQDGRGAALAASAELPIIDDPAAALAVAGRITGGAFVPGDVGGKAWVEALLEDEPRELLLGAMVREEAVA